MKFLRRIFFEWMYFRSPPWDSGIVPPELVDFVAHHPPGKALDLGCGTGTNAIYLAKNGWQVTAVDFSWKALRIAKRKNKAQGTNIKFLHEDVSNLRKVHGVFDLILDIGCFHGLSAQQKQKYLQQLEELLSPDGTYLLYGFIQSPSNKPAIRPEDIQAIQESMVIVNQQLGTDNGRNSIWLLIKKKSSPSNRT